MTSLRAHEPGWADVLADHAVEDATGRRLIARGFTGPDELLAEMRSEAARVLDECLADDVSEIKLLQEHLHDAVGQLVYDRTRRRPMILPVIVEV